MGRGFADAPLEPAAMLLQAAFYLCLPCQGIPDGVGQLLHGHMAAGVADVDNAGVVIHGPATIGGPDVPGLQQLPGCGVVADLAVALVVVYGLPRDFPEINHLDTVLVHRFGLPSRDSFDFLCFPEIIGDRDNGETGLALHTLANTDDPGSGLVLGKVSGGLPCGLCVYADDLINAVLLIADGVLIFMVLAS